MTGNRWLFPTSSSSPRRSWSPPSPGQRRIDVLVGSGRGDCSPSCTGAGDGPGQRSHDERVFRRPPCTILPSRSWCLTTVKSNQRRDHAPVRTADKIGHGCLREFVQAVRRGVLEGRLCARRGSAGSPYEQGGRVLRPVVGCPGAGAVAIDPARRCSMARRIGAAGQEPFSTSASISSPRQVLHTGATDNADQLSC